MARAAAADEENTAFMVFDDRVARKFSAWPNPVSTFPGVAYAYVEDYRRYRPDVYHGADTIEELAQSTGLDPVVLRSTVDEWNADVATGTDSQFDRQRLGGGVSEGPFYALGPMNAFITLADGAGRRHRTARNNSRRRGHPWTVGRRIHRPGRAAVSTTACTSAGRWSPDGWLAATQLRPRTVRTSNPLNTLRLPDGSWPAGKDSSDHRRLTGHRTGNGSAAGGRRLQPGPGQPRRRRLEDLAGTIRAQHGVSVSLMAADLSSAAEEERVGSSAGDLDVLVNNAGAIPPGTFQEIDDPQWREAWDLKVFGYINLPRALVREPQGTAGSHRERHRRRGGGPSGRTTSPGPRAMPHSWHLLARWESQPRRTDACGGHQPRPGFHPPE